jgi:hypothetical protein
MTPVDAIDVASLPALGSVSAKHGISIPDANLGRYLSFCYIVP